MEYYIYNNTDYTVSITDVHYINSYESSDGGVIGITPVFRIEPHSWNTTRRCSSEEVEQSIAVGCINSSVKKGNIIVCSKDEYFEKMHNNASSKLEVSLGISGQEKEAKQDFGFLNKVVKKSNTTEININDFLIDDSSENIEDIPQVEIPVEENNRITNLESAVVNIQSTLNNLIDTLNNTSVQKKSKRKSNVQNRKRKQ